ncbi:hypothetical protein [Desulfosporosinus nitroreducens]|nr:hypothetical protein [Desulfosporosinus nitroreducens]MCO1603751.1 hypothetical protein [Desulfosporosinus nitroreducens]
MDRPASNSSVRRYIAYVSTLGTTQLHLRSPIVIAWWSLAFPGLGHLLLSKYLRGYLLFIWELFVNTNAHINLAMLYSFTGRFQMAKDVLDINWVLLYIPTYIFAVWDAYRTTIDLNHQYILATREDAEVKMFNISAIEINYLDKRTPWNAAMWSALMPGLGQVLIHQIPAALFMIIWFIVIIQQSKFLPAFHYTLMGQFDYAKSIINPQWFLNLPSVYLSAIYDAYQNTTSNNKVFDWEQTKFLKKNYENKNFRMPVGKMDGSGERMYIVSTFDHSNYLELAITAIQMKGIAKENILGVSLDKKGEDRKLFDTLHSSDGLSLLDLPMILATLFCLFGGIYGFILAWGPILWGLIGLFAGFSLGLIIKL